jgi:hypothetical protein
MGKWFLVSKRVGDEFANQGELQLDAALFPALDVVFWYVGKMYPGLGCGYKGRCTMHG